MSLKIKGHTPDQALTDAITRWGLDPKDPQLRSSVGRLAEAWLKWTEAHRWQFLTVVEAVAEGERWKGKKRRLARASRYRQLRVTGLGAFELAAGILRQFPAEIASNFPAVQGTVVALASLGMGCVAASGIPDKVNIYPVVKAAQDVLRNAHGRIHQEMVAEIVSLVVGRTVTADTVRRYLTPGSLKAAGFAEWRKHEALILSVEPFADPLIVQQWIAAGLAFLAALE